MLFVIPLGAEQLYYIVNLIKKARGKPNQININQAVLATSKVLSLIRDGRSSFSHSMALSIPFGSLPGVFKYFSNFNRFKYLKGYYYVCNQQENRFINSPEGIPNFLKISIGWLSPSTLRIVSKDFDRTNFHRWKTWSSEIPMNGHAGTGRYLYDIGNETGMHEIVLQGRDKIIVRVIDTGKADWKRNKDNEPASQVWIRVSDSDPMLETFKNILA